MKEQDEIIEMPEYLNASYEGDDLYTGDQVRELMKLIAEREREACAKVCDELPTPDIYSVTDQSMWDITCIDCAAAIRARGANT
jgi:hypothetical protein